MLIRLSNQPDMCGGCNKLTGRHPLLTVGASTADAGSLHCIPMGDHTMSEAVLLDV